MLWSGALTGCVCHAGNVSLTCVFTASQPGLPLAVYLAPSLIGALLLCIAIPLAFVYWRRLAADLASYKQMWHKRRSANELCLLPSHCCITGPT